MEIVIAVSILLLAAAVGAIYLIVAMILKFKGFFRARSIKKADVTYMIGIA
ncbi:hypothetical protein FACS189487_01830 [Campylobacterota bacterium]|nr:hypothetical protein FACS189487_01830 [Campylobacterota bacterium]